MDVKEIDVGFETVINGSDMKKYTVSRFHHIANPVRMHLIENKKYDGSPLIRAIEKQGDSWFCEGKEFLRMTPEHDACELLLDAVIRRVHSMK